MIEEKVSEQETQKKKYRLQIDFSEEVYKELESLQGQLNIPSKSEVIRDALGILRWAVDGIRDGNRILVEKKGGEVWAMRRRVTSYGERGMVNRKGGAL